MVKMLLKDERVNINEPDKCGCTPLWWASCRGQIEKIKWMIASGRELDLEKKGRYYGEESTPIEIGQERGKTEVVNLLEKFMNDPIKTRNEIRNELNIQGFNF